MEKAAVWPTIQAQRAALAADLEGVDDAGWATPSPCEGWTVHDVLAHMTATARITPPSFFAKMIAAGFSLKKMQAKEIAIHRGSSPADALSRFKAEVASRKHPPGPTDTWLGEVIVHAEDIRRPLGITHDYPVAAVIRVADSYKGSNLVIGAKRRIDGLRLTATDADWGHGDGPEVSGPMIALLVAMTGRSSANVDLSGEGVATLAAR